MRPAASATREPGGQARLPGGWIDVHHHSYHPDLTAALRHSGVTGMAPGIPLPEWTLEESLQVMDAESLSAAVLSVLLPDGSYDVAAIARLANERSASVVAVHPGKFAALATLPLPDVGAALAELTYALDVLGLDGVTLSASQRDGRLLGDREFAPVLDELNRRQAVAFIHPRPAVRCNCTGGPGFAAEVPPPVLDFVVDTTRAVAGLLFGGTLRRCPGIKFILAHSGGTVPYLAGRFGLAGTRALAEPRGATPETVAAALRGLYYETAQSFWPGTLACLQAVTDDSHILFGTDYPFMRQDVIASSRETISGYPGLNHAAARRENALALFPRLGAQPA